MLAAQGFIVAAPNYAGYDKSTLPYHSYLNGDQQGKDMVDALTAARQSASPTSTPGGRAARCSSPAIRKAAVALAAHREMQATGKSRDGLGAAVGALGHQPAGRATTAGLAALGSTLFVPLLATSWQQQFGDVYSSPPATSTRRSTPPASRPLLPSLTPTSTLIAQGKLPQLALFPAGATPGSGAIPSCRSSTAPTTSCAKATRRGPQATSQASPAPAMRCRATSASLNSSHAAGLHAHGGLRKAAVANDLRNWVPASARC